MKVLYIEDNPHLALFVLALLGRHGYEVEHFALGQPALARFRLDPPSWDAAVVDLELPDGPGQALIPEIAALRPALPILVYSGEKKLTDRFELYALGATALVSKPCGAQDLLDVLKGLIDLPPVAIN